MAAVAHRVLSATMGLPAPGTSFEDDIIDSLKSDFEQKLRALNRLRSKGVNDEHWFEGFRRKADLFVQFNALIADCNWEVQHQTIKFLADSMHLYANDVDWCMAICLQSLVHRLGSNRMTIRRMSTQALTQYQKYTKAHGTLQTVLIRDGILIHTNATNRLDALREYSALILAASEQSLNVDWTKSVQHLTDMLCAKNIDEQTADQIFVLLELIIDSNGQEHFNQSIAQLPELQREQYETLLLGRSVTQPPSHTQKNTLTKTHQLQAPDSLKFGIIPKMVMQELNMESDSRIRLQGLDNLKKLIGNIDNNQLTALCKELDAYLHFLDYILDDLNFKVIALCLELLKLSVNKLKGATEPHVALVVSAVAKHMSNQKLVIRQLLMLTTMDLMQHTQPMHVMNALLVYLRHRNSRVREELLNMATAALLHFPSSAFSLPSIMRVIAPVLADNKRRVRLASFELMAVLAQNLGAGKLECLWSSVRQVYPSNEHQTELLLNAVQARLARHQLPRVRHDGLIEYVTVIPPATGTLVTADLQWIMAGTIATGSALSRSLSSKRRLAQQQQTSAVVHNPIGIATQVNQASVRLSQTRMPWDDDLELYERHSAPVRPFPKRRESEAPTKSKNDHRRNTKFDKNEMFHALDARSIKKDSVAIFRSKTYNGGSVTSGYSNEPNEQINNAYLAHKKSARSLEDRDYQNGARRSLSPIKNSQSNDMGRSLDRAHFNSLRPPNGRSKANSLIDIEEPTKQNNRWSNGPSKSISHSAFPSTSASAPAAPAQESPRRKSIHNNRRDSNEQKNANIKKAQSSSHLVRNESDNNHRPHHSNPPSKSRNIQVTQRSSSKPPPAKRDSNSGGRAGRAGAGGGNLDLAQALDKIGKEQWEEKVLGLQAIKSLCDSKPSAITNDLRTVCTAVNSESKNLRSSVSREALQASGALFRSLKQTMDSETDKMTSVLLTKSGDVSSAFIRDDAVSALEMMVDHVTPTKACNALITAGASSKSVQIRTSTAQLLCRLVENQGAAKIMSTRDLYEKMLPACVAFSRDAQAQPRKHGRQALQHLSTEKSFSSLMKKCCTDSDIKHTEDVLAKGRR